jgi:hypothetical protein
MCFKRRCPDAEQLSLLLRLLMESMFAAETAILVHFETVRIVLFVFDRVVVSLFAFAAGERNSYAHGFNTSQFLRTKK